MYRPKNLTINQYFEKPINYQELIRGFYDLNYREFTVLCALHQLQEADTEDIMDQTAHGWPKNKINSALKKLKDIGLCTRKRVSPENQSRGYKYVYTSRSPEEIADEMLNAFDEFVIQAQKELQNLNKHMLSVNTKEYKIKKTKKEELREEWFED